MSAGLFKQFEPDAGGLLRGISAHVSDEVLREISIADYGEGAEEHFLALRQIRDHLTFPTKMYWYPAEVLELIRWSEPENPDWKPGRTGEFGHWMRAFSCAALLRATRGPWNYGDGVGTDSTTIQLILSLEELPIHFTSEAVRFFAWLLTEVGSEGFADQICAYAIALCWCALRNEPHFADQQLIAVLDWTVRRAEELYSGSAVARFTSLFEMVSKCQCGSSWKKLALKLLELDLHAKSPELRMQVEILSESMSG